MSVTAIILAAGKSTRMKSRLPKPLHELSGRPMLQWILDACYDAGVTRVLLVVGFGKDKIIARFGSDRRITFVEQTEQLGTGHAVKVCAPHLRGSTGQTFILCADTPLVRGESLRTLLEAHRSERVSMTLGTAVIDDPTGYGRIVRDASGEFVAIVEQQDCTPEQASIREVNPSFYVAETEPLLDAVGKLKNENRKREYYLTDVPGILRAEGKRVAVIQALSAEDIAAPNTRQQLAEAELVMQDRIHRRLRDAGVTIVSSANTYIEAGVTVGPETLIHPFTFIGRDASIGADCTIGPFASLPRESIVPDGTTLAGNISPDSTLVERD